MNGRNTNPCLRNMADCTHSLHSPYYIMIASYYITLSKNRTSSKPGLTSRTRTRPSRETWFPASENNVRKPETESQTGIMSVERIKNVVYATPARISTVTT